MNDKIPTLKPDTFKKLLMANIDHFQLDVSTFNEFYIHDLSKETYKLKLPLPPHRKTVNDFILVTDGKMTKSAGIDSYEVTKNTIFLLPAGQITATTQISENLSGFYCHFSTDFIAESKSQIDILNKVPFLKLSSNDCFNLTNLLKRIENIYTQNPNYELIRSYLFTFLTEIKTLQKTEKNIGLTATEKIAFEFKHILTKHVTNHHEARFYAKQLHVSPNHLNRCVKKVFRKSVTQHIADLLILEAKVLLHQQSIPIADISFSIGFEDPSYFGRFFKKQTRQTPTEFRLIIDLSEQLPL